MSGELLHSPERVIQQLIVELGHGVLGGDTGNWPVYNGVMPDKPEELIVVTSTTGRLHGRLQTNGEMVESYGFQVRTRSADVSNGFLKAKQIFDSLTKNVRNYEVVIDLESYRVHVVTSTTTIINIGLDATSRRRNWTFNALASISLLASTGTGS